MTDVPETETAAKPRRRWMKPLFIASLALNLLVLGAVAGWAFRHGGPHGSWGGGRHGGPDRILWLLPDDKARWRPRHHRALPGERQRA